MDFDKILDKFRKLYKLNHDTSPNLHNLFSAVFNDINRYSIWKKQQ